MIKRDPVAAIGLLTLVVAVSACTPTGASPKDPLAKMKEVARLVEAGEIAPDAKSYGTTVALPDEYASASSGGEVKVFRGDDGFVIVVFFTTLGVIDSYEGIVYWGGDHKFCCGDPLGGVLQEVTELETGWYRIKAH